MAFLILLSCPALLPAQPDSVLLDKRFEFEDGLYFTFEEFQSNRPALKWDEVDAQLVSSGKSYMAQVEYIRMKGGEEVALDSVWGLSLAGMPYIRLPDSVQQKSATTFAGLRVRGRICYFSYELEETKMVEVAAYNPLTGRPFRKGMVSRKVAVDREYILHFESGQQLPFRRENLLAWIEDDPALWRTVRELDEEEAQQKLYKCLLIYDDRNHAYIPKP